LQTLAEIGTEKKSTVIFPMPILQIIEKVADQH